MMRSAKLIPAARVGFDGVFVSTSFVGYDFYQLMKVNSVQNVYDHCDQRELLRSFASKDALTGIWLGAYWAHFSPLPSIHLNPHSPY